VLIMLFHMFDRKVVFTFFACLASVTLIELQLQVTLEEHTASVVWCF